MHKDILYSDEARKKLVAGVDKLANAVKVTLGPRGKTVAFERGTPIFSLDGVTVAKQITLKDRGENMGAQMVIDVARNTDKEAGDGTTTATILAQSILKAGMKALAAGIDHTQMKKGIDAALELAQGFIKRQARPVKTQKDISNVATISSRDREVGDMVAEVVHSLGKDAVITVEESKVMGLFKEMVEGLKLDKGFIAPHFITNSDRGQAVLENPRILVTSQVVSTNEDIYKIMEEVRGTDHRALVVIADTVKGAALPTLIINKLNGILKSVAITAPGIGDDKREQLQDIATLVGANLISEETGMKVEDATLSDLGQAEKVVVGKDYTIIIGGKGKPAEIKKRVALIKQEMKQERADFELMLREKRVAKLTGGVAVIKIGTISEQENMEKRYRIEDAVRSAKSAVEEGIVEGAGMTLYRASQFIEDKMEKERDLSFRTGMEIIKEAIKEPARQIIKNAGSSPDEVLAKISKDQGYNSATGEYQELISAGVIDPAKVVRTALSNAVSIASLFLITEALLVDVEEKKDAKEED